MVSDIQSSAVALPSLILDLGLVCSSLHDSICIPCVKCSSLYCFGLGSLSDSDPVLEKWPTTHHTSDVSQHLISNQRLGVLPQGKGVRQDQRGQRQRSPEAPPVSDLQRREQGLWAGCVQRPALWSTPCLRQSGKPGAPSWFARVTLPNLCDPPYRFVIVIP